MNELTHSRLSMMDSFEERFEYLSLLSRIGDRTFGGERWMNQDFYRSYEWKLARQKVIARDSGCDLGVEGYEIFDRIIVHHMNPVTRDQVAYGDPVILDPEFLISVSHNTHNAIHFGDRSLIPNQMVERQPNDTRPWLL